MCIQFKIWKLLITNQLPLSCHRPSTAMSLLPSLPVYGKPHIQFVNFCNQMVTASTTPPDRGFVTDFLIRKCGLTEKDITKAFRHCTYRLREISNQNMEEVWELLKGCGLTTPAQARRVFLSNPNILFQNSERIIKPKLSFIRTFVKQEDVFKLVVRDASVFQVREDALKSRTSHLVRLGFDGKALSHLVAMRPRLLKISEKRVTELFNQIENLGFKKGSKSFAVAVSVFLGLGKKTLEQKLQCLRSLGFSEKQISDLSRRYPRILALSEEKMKRHMDFVVNSMGLLLADFLKYPLLFEASLEKTIIPRYRVMETLKSMRVEELKREKRLPPIFYLTEKHFLDKYVNNNPEFSILLDIYHGGKAGKVIIDKEETQDERVLIKEIQGS